MSVFRQMLVVAVCVVLAVLPACGAGDDGPIPSQACSEWARERLDGSSWASTYDDVYDAADSGYGLRDLIEEHGGRVMQGCEDNFLRWRYRVHGF